MYELFAVIQLELKCFNEKWSLEGDVSALNW